MKAFTADDAKARFDDLIDVAQREPVCVVDNDQVIGVMVSSQDFSEMRAFYVDRLTATINRTAHRATDCGMTEERLARLLADKC